MDWNLLFERYFIDPSLDEVLINGGEQALFIHGAQTFKALSPFESSGSMLKACQQLAWSQNQRLDPLMPAAGGLWERKIGDIDCQFRWHCILPPISRDGPLLSLRRHRLSTLNLLDFAPSNTCELMSIVAQAPGPLFIAGPTGAGKTSLMIALLRKQAENERVAILEQVAELPRLEPSWIRLRALSQDLEGQGAFSLNQTFDELLRLRPDRIVIGELRQKDEVKALHRAWLAGHGSVWSTLHVQGPHSLADRLADLAQDESRKWERLLQEHGAGLILLGRGHPKIIGIWQWQKDGLRELYKK